MHKYSSSLKWLGSVNRDPAGRWQHWDGWSGDHLSAAAGLRWLLSKITCIWSSRLWFVSVPTAKWRQRQLPAAQRDNWKVKVRRCHKISTSPDVPQIPVRASTKWWRMFKSAQSCCPHSRKEEIRVRPWRRSTHQWLRWVKLYRQQLLAWFFTRRSSLGEEQSLKFSVEISPGIHPKACGKLQVTLIWMKVWSLAKNVWPPD